MRLRVLVFDDDPVIRRTMSMFLLGRGYEVFVFPNPGLLPLNLTHVPMGVFADVIFSDLEMPGVKGLDFVEDLLRKGLQCPAIALMSGVWTEAHFQRARQIGCKLLAKPLQTTELAEWLDRVEKNVKPDRVLVDWNTIKAAAP